MRYRKLRIAWSVGCLIACVLLIVLWVRSHWRSDIAISSLSANWCGVISTAPGEIIVQRYTPNNNSGWWGISSYNVQDVYHAPPYISVFGFGLLSSGGRQGVFIPFWSLVLGTAACSTIASRGWKRQFSLRTLLIATTLVAVVLGAIVWLRYDR